VVLRPGKENGEVYYELESIEELTTRDVLYNLDGTGAEIEESIPSRHYQQTRRKHFPRSIQDVVTKVEKITRGDVTGV